MLRSIFAAVFVLLFALVVAPVFGQDTVYFPLLPDGNPGTSTPVPTLVVTRGPLTTSSPMPTQTSTETVTETPTATSTSTPTETPTVTPTFTPTFTPTSTTTPCGTLEGVIAVDTTLTAGCGYDVTGNLVVTQSVTLSMPAGTSLRLGPGLRVTVEGSLHADGTETEPVKFTRNTETHWGGIHITEKSSNSSLFVNAVFEYSYIGLRAVDSQPTLSNLTFQYNVKPFEVYGAADSPLVTLSGGRVISNTETAGLGRGNQILTDYYFADNTSITGDAIFTVCPGSQVLNSTFVNNRQTAIKVLYCLNDNGILIKDNVISGNQGAIRTVQFSNVVIESNNILDNDQVLIANFGYSYTGSAIFTDCDTRLTANNIYSNTAIYAAGGRHGTGCEVDATNNWWGTTDSAEVDALIFDADDEIPRVNIIHSPISPAPNP